MAQSEPSQILQTHSVKWKPIASMDVLDGRQYEHQHQFNQAAAYHIHSVAEYIAVDCDFAAVSTEDQFPRLIPNTASLIHQDLNEGFKEVLLTQ